MENNFNRITAVLGPTNTGKTHLAVETMLSFDSGILGFPLRLLAREIFDRCVKKVGSNKVALITGEEKIIPKEPKYFICTVESMPQNIEVDFVAIDEIQLAADYERGLGQWMRQAETPRLIASCWKTVSIHRLMSPHLPVSMSIPPPAPTIRSFSTAVPTRA